MLLSVITLSELSSPSLPDWSARVTLSGVSVCLDVKLFFNLKIEFFYTRGLDLP